MSFVVALDGPAGSGKGTVTKKVAEILNLSQIDTGAMYRCVSLAMIQQKISLDEKNKIEEMLKEIDIKFKEENGITKVFLNDEDVTKIIREEEVNNIVSQVSHIVCVREAMVEMQRNIAKGKNIIMEGRDIGTNVFPDAEVKIYLDASPEERANRRYKQNIENGIECSYEKILENVKFRDHNDLTSIVGTLKKHPEAVVVDSTNMKIEDVIDKVVNIIKEKIS